MRSAVTAAFLIVFTLPALAEGGLPVLVIPGRPGVPVPIAGLDASYAVVEGDWGLAKNIQVAPHVYGGRLYPPPPDVGHYFPSAGHQPGYGRLEITPPVHRRQHAESYYQSWSAQSAPQPPDPPQYPPPVIVAPPLNGPIPGPRGH